MNEINEMNAQSGKGTLISRFLSSPLWVKIVAGVLLLAVLGGIVFGAIALIRLYRESQSMTFDFVNGDLSPYVELDPALYRGKAISAKVDPITDRSVENAILQALCANKTKTPSYDGAYVKNLAVTPGDKVYIYYRGYLEDEDGSLLEPDGTSNYREDAPSELEIGSGSFVEGFELDLVGKSPADSGSLKKIVSGTVEEGDVVYITFTGIRTVGAGIENYQARLDLSDDRIEAAYGVGIAEALVGREIGRTDMKGLSLPLAGTEGEEIYYTDIRVDFVTRCEAHPIVVETYFPVDYDSEILAGKTVKFDVFLEKVQVYAAPEFNDTFVHETLGYSDEDLADYEGEGATGKYRTMLREGLEAQIEEARRASLEDAAWDAIDAAANVKGLPEKEITRVFDQNYYALQDTYREEGSMYGSLDDFARAYYGLSEGTDWRTYLRREISSEVRERLIFFAAIRKEGLLPSQEEYERAYEKQVEDTLAYYLDYFNIVRSGYETDEEYEAAKNGLRAEMIAYYTDQYFVENAYYAFAIDGILALFEIDGE